MSTANLALVLVTVVAFVALGSAAGAAPRLFRWVARWRADRVLEQERLRQEQLRTQILEEQLRNEILKDPRRD